MVDGDIQSYTVKPDWNSVSIDAEIRATIQKQCRSATIPSGGQSARPLRGLLAGWQMRRLRKYARPAGRAILYFCLL
eukprot:6207655-Pleurochrysis_carterae.AAC.1